MLPNLPLLSPRSSLISSLATSEIVILGTFDFDDFDVILVDTPGFDNVMKADIIILDEFMEFLRIKACEGIELSGILYLHRITDVRMGGSARRNVRLLQELCGETFLPRLTLVTTMWDIVNESVGARREEELRENFWKHLVQHGAIYQRWDGTRDGTYGALRVIERYLNDPPLQTTTANIQQQAAKPLIDTDAAGRFQLQGLYQIIQQYTARLDEMKRALMAMGYNAQLGEERAEIGKEVRRLQVELDRYKDLFGRYSRDSHRFDPRDAEDG
jgi:hypothetical protein